MLLDYLYLVIFIEFLLIEWMEVFHRDGWPSSNNLRKKPTIRRSANQRQGGLLPNIYHRVPPGSVWKISKTLNVAVVSFRKSRNKTFLANEINILPPSRHKKPSMFSHQLLKSFRWRNLFLWRGIFVIYPFILPTPTLFSGLFCLLFGLC